MQRLAFLKNTFETAYITFPKKKSPQQGDSLAVDFLIQYCGEIRFGACNFLSGGQRPTFIFRASFYALFGKGAYGVGHLAVKFFAAEKVCPHFIMRVGPFFSAELAGNDNSLNMRNRAVIV